MDVPNPNIRGESDECLLSSLRADRSVFVGSEHPRNGLGMVRSGRLFWAAGSASTLATVHCSGLWRLARLVEKVRFPASGDRHPGTCSGAASLDREKLHDIRTLRA